MAHGTMQPAVRLAWAAFVVQAVAVGFHQTWHMIGFAEPPSDIGHYLLLHFPLHVGVVMLGAAAVWLARRTGFTLALGLLVVGTAVQHAGAGVDVMAVFGDAPHGAAAVLLIVGGGLALSAAALRGRRPRTAPSP